MSIISQILVSSKDLIVDKKTSDKEKLSDLRENEVVKAKVVKVVSSREVVLSFGDEKVSAKTFVPLDVGDEVLLRLSDAKNNQVFKLLSKLGGNEMSEYLGSIKSLGRGGPLESLFKMLSGFTSDTSETTGTESEKTFKQFENLLKNFSLKSETADPAFLKNLIKMSGISWERNLFSAISSKKDLKDESVNAFIRMLFSKMSDKNPEAAKLLNALNASPSLFSGKETEIKNLFIGFMDQLVEIKTGMDISDLSERFFSGDADSENIISKNLSKIIDELSSHLLSEPFEKESNSAILKQGIQNLLKSIIENDLKAYSLKLMMEKSDSEAALTKLLSDFVDKMDQFQQFNQTGMEDSTRFLLPLPFLSGESIKFGQLFIDLGKKQGGDSEGEKKEGIVKISFILQMSGLGDLIADFSVLNKGINGSFGVEDESIKVLMENHFPELIEKLKLHGFTVYNIKCQVVGKEALSAASLADRMIPSEEGGLSIII